MTELIRQFIEGLELGPLPLLLLALGATIEYIFPPFPGDVVVLAGAFMVGARGWNAAAVFSAISLGSLAGMYFIFAAGRYLERTQNGWRTRFALGARIGRAVDKILPYFSKNAPLYLAINRFLPSIRSLFFLAAGMARIRLRTVLVWGGLSALAWNAILLAAGSAVGDNWEKLYRFLGRYQLVTWTLLGLAVLALVVYFLRKRRKP